MAQAVEQPASRRPALGKIIWARRIDLGQPKVLVLLCYPAVINTAELAVSRPDESGRDARVGLGLGVEDPARRGAGETVGPGLEVCGFWVRRPPEEDVAVGDG